MTAAERAARTTRADALCRTAFDSSVAGAPAEVSGDAVEAGVALVAVGGYGRGELAPHSDLDVVLVHDEGVDPAPIAETVWYPMWDAGVRLDHSVRSMPEMVAAADKDLKVALGVLDLRHLAGDPNLTLRLRTTMLGLWRRSARERLPELQAMVRQRHELLGELAHGAVPDVKEAYGGLRDATVLKALEATWLVDASAGELEPSRQALLDVRDLLHAEAGRPVDRIAPEMWDPLAGHLQLPDGASAQRHVRELGRRIAHLSRLTWRRVDGVLARPASVRRARTPALEAIGSGLALSRGEVVLSADAKPEQDPTLLLRAAAAAASRDAVLSPSTAARLVRSGSPLPEPWPDTARDALVTFLSSGDGVLPVWETLEETGAVRAILPEWSRIRLLPHASVIHRFTVDRHVIETCIEAGALIRRVARPDVLLVAALLHDIGKGGLTEHSVAGEPIARTVALRMGFAPEDADLVALLVRWHLLLADLATTRDPEDPATMRSLLDRVPSRQGVELLLALTEADARATTPKAWSTWRAGLVRSLATRAAALASGSTPPPMAGDVPIPSEVRVGGVAISVEPTETGASIRVVALDRLGLLADVAATLADQRLRAQSARAWSQELDDTSYAVSVWQVSDDVADPAVLRERLLGIAAGRVDHAERLRRPSAGALPPAVSLHPDASEAATVIEVRTDDRPGVVYRVCSALASLRISVRSAHVATVGPQAVDVFYVQEEGAGRLADARATEAVRAVRAAFD